MSDIYKMLERMDETQRKRGYILDAYGRCSADILDAIRGDENLLEAWNMMNAMFLQVCSALRIAHKHLTSADMLCDANMKGAKEMPEAPDTTVADYAKTLHKAISLELSVVPVMVYGDGELLYDLLKVYFEPKAEEEKGGDDKEKEPLI